MLLCRSRSLRSLPPPVVEGVMVNPYRALHMRHSPMRIPIRLRRHSPADLAVSQLC
jgi:hypothetical protein